MTFEQTELQKLLDEIIGLLERYSDDPSVIEAVLSELKAIYQKIPIYPGIITVCLPKVVTLVKAKQLNKGSEVALRLKDGRTLSGKVLEVTPAEIRLTNCHEFGPQRPCADQAVPVDDLREVRLLTREILQKEWPDLDFQE